VKSKPKPPQRTAKELADMLHYCKQKLARIRAASSEEDAVHDECCDLNIQYQEALVREAKEYNGKKASHAR
jgi:hypothetical protein